jgi:hypothetical protein
MGGAAAAMAGVALLRLATAGEPAPPPPPVSVAPRAIASYEWSAVLDAVTHTVSGRGTIRWINGATVPANDIYIHLYLNAFKNDRSLYLRSPYGAGRSGNAARDFGTLDVKRLIARELGGVDLWPAAERHSPGDPQDETDVRVPLPEAVAPGQTLTLDVQFEAKLPEIVERTGYSGSFHFVGQWFPKLARRLPDGTWVHFPFHAQSEFYADFGDYSVTLDVPENMRVGATGVRVEERAAGGRRVVRTSARSVHDFAWVAWDGFEELQTQIGAVQVRLLYPAGYDRDARAELEAVRFALPYFESRYGSYPYPALTVVHPPEHARSSGGMEYPMLIATGGPWYASYGSRVVESVTIHELAHQWFYGLLATDEHAWPFLDEGLASYAEGQALEARYGTGSLLDLPDWPVSRWELERWFALEHGADDVIAQPAASFRDFESLGGLVYARTALMLRTLAGVYGSDAVQRALGRYARAGRFGHPGPEELLGAVRAELGADAAEQFRRALFERGWVDYRVTTLRAARPTAPAGVFDHGGRRESQPRGVPAPGDAWLGRATIVRAGTLELPVDIDLVAEDGTCTRRRWDGHGTGTTIDVSGATRLVRVVIDPDRRIAIDDDFTNNARSAKPEPPRAVLERASYLAELVLGLLGP